MSDDLVFKVDAFTRLEFDEFANEMRALRHPDAASEDWPLAVRETFARLMNGDRLRRLSSEERRPLTEWADEYHEELSTMREWDEAMRVVDHDPQLAAIYADEIAVALSSAYAKRGVNADKALKALAPQRNAESASERAQRRASVRASMRHAREKVERAKSADGLAPGLGAESPKALRELRRAALRDKRVARIMRLAGALRLHAKAQVRRVRGRGYEETVGVELGGDIHALLPTELGLLGAGGLRAAEAFSRIVDRSALVYERRGEEERRAERGPIVVLVDSSGSMKGDAHDTALAVATYMAAECVRQKRGFAFANFNAAIHSQIVFKKRVDLDRFLKAACVNPCGGTKPTAALRWASEVVSKEFDGQADVILITDGYLPNSTRDEVERLRQIARLFGVFVGHQASRRMKKAPFAPDEATAIETFRSENLVEVGRKVGSLTREAVQ